LEGLETIAWAVKKIDPEFLSPAPYVNGRVNREFLKDLSIVRADLRLAGVSRKPVLSACADAAYALYAVELHDYLESFYYSLREPADQWPEVITDCVHLWVMDVLKEAVRYYCAFLQRMLVRAAEALAYVQGRMERLVDSIA
jgi:hypothetical protein